MNWGQINNGRKKYIRLGERMFRRALAETRRRLESDVRAAQTTADLERIFGNVAINGEMDDAFDMFYQTTGTAFAKMTYRRLKSYQDFEIKEEEDLDALWRAIMAQYVSEKAGPKIQGVINTQRKTWNRILDKAVAEGMDKGWGVDQMAREILKQGTRTEKWQAMRIARTEALSASNYGSYKGAETTGIPMVKRWLPTTSKEPREDHRAMVGNTVDFTADFVLPNNVHMELPGDPSAPMGETVNCSCGVTFLPKQDVALPATEMIPI